MKKLNRNIGSGRSPACAGRSNGRNKWYVYILKSLIKKWYYVGSTNRLELRIKEHNLGKTSSTKQYLPLELVYKIEFDNEKSAREYERKIKDKRREKEQLVRIIENKK